MSEKTYELPEGEHSHVEFWGVGYLRESTRSTRSNTESHGYTISYQLPHGDEIVTRRSRHYLRDFHVWGEDPDPHLTKEVDFVEW